MTFARYDHATVIVTLRHEAGWITALRLEMPPFAADWQAERQPDGRWSLTVQIGDSVSHETLAGWPEVYDSIPQGVAHATREQAMVPVLRVVQRYLDKEGRATAPGQVESVEDALMALVVHIEKTWGIDRAVDLLRVGLRGHGYRVLPDPEFIAEAGTDCAAYVEIKSRLAEKIEASGHDDAVIDQALRRLEALETAIAAYQRPPPNQHH